MMPVRAAEREGFAAFLLRMRAAGIDDKRLFAAIETTPRRAFIPGEWQDAAFGSRTLPIACGESVEGLDLQAMILSSLDISQDARVLEIGTGSGFTAAVMARLAARVTTVDRFKSLGKAAQERFQTLGLGNILFRHGDADQAVRGEGPYDRIVVWAAFETLPRHFTDLLSSGGVMIAPMGPADGEQTLLRLTKIGSRFERIDIGKARFQPLARGVAQSL